MLCYIVIDISASRHGEPCGKGRVLFTLGAHIELGTRLSGRGRGGFPAYFCCVMHVFGSDSQLRTTRRAAHSGMHNVCRLMVFCVDGACLCTRCFVHHVFSS